MSCPQPKLRLGVSAAALGGLVTLGAGCVSVPESAPVELAERHKQYFAACAPSDGSLRLEWERAKAGQAGPFELDWLAKAPDAWQLQMFDPLGRIVFELTSAVQGGLSSGGALAKKLPTLARNGEGYLQAAGFAIGLRSDEVPCLLGSSFPDAWLKLLHAKRSEASQEVFYGGDERRQLSLSFARSSTGKEGAKAAACAQIEWDQLWGLKTNKLTWCIEERGKASYLLMPKSYKLHWKHNDG